MSSARQQHGEEQQHGGDIADLQDNFSKQQEKISALKELVRKSEVAHGKSASSAQEKVKSIAQRLTQLKSKAKTRNTPELPHTEQAISHEPEHEPVHTYIPPAPQTHQMPLSSTPHTTPSRPFDGNASGSEKILLLRQQMEQSRALMAQRASSKQHLEQLVTQLKEKLDSTQQSLEDTTELGRSMGDLSILAQAPETRGERHRSATDLLATQPAFSLERERIKFLENRCRVLEKQLDKERQANSTSSHENSAQSLKRVKELENKVVELEQALKESEQEIERKSDAEERLSKEIEVLRSSGGGDEPATEQSDDKSVVIEELRRDVDRHSKRIAELEALNDMLATTNDDLSVKCNKLQELLHEKEHEVLHMQDAMLERREELDKAESKCVALQNELDKLEKHSQSAALPAALNTDLQVNAEMAKQIQELQDELLLLRAENAQLQSTMKEQEHVGISDESIAEKIAALEATIESQRLDLQTRLEANKQLEEQLMEKTIELNVVNANFQVLQEKLQGSTKAKPLFSASESDTGNAELQREVQELKQKLDESNKAMIKLKLKAKQTEKQIEKLKKSSELHAEVTRLESLNVQLQQKLTELEDEKGQWQLALVDDDDVETAAVKRKPEDNEKMHELERKCEQQTETIQVLKSQELEYQHTAEALRRELQELRHSVEQQQHDEETARLKTEMSGIQLEEQLELKQREIDALKERLTVSQSALDEQQRDLAELKQQKQELDKKLEHYLAENVELMDKMNKLSKSSSSAESIEIVERLTHQERAEMDELTKRLDGVSIRETELAGDTGTAVHELTQTTEMGLELSESLVKLREESSELMKKIELFTTERREVLEKMEHLTAENNGLLQKIDEVVRQKEQLEAQAVLAAGAKLKLELQLQELSKEKDLLALQVAESSAQKSQLSQELTSMQKSSEVVAALDCADGASLFDKCEKSLAKLNSELESYRKANDKNAKFNACKKLAKEAKNAYTQLSELLLKVKEASSAVETVTVVETVVAVTAPNGKALAEYEQLTMQNRELKARIEQLMQQLQSMRDEMAEAEDVTAARAPAIAAALTDASTAADVDAAAKLEEALRQVGEYAEQVQHLEAVVADVRAQLQQSHDANAARTDELESLRKLAAEFDQVMSDKKTSYEQQIEQLTRLRLQLEGKCETYEGEMEILQTLVAEQKQQLIEAYKENEHAINLKLLELQERDQQIEQLRSELQDVKRSSQNVGLEASEHLQRECDKLRESLKISKALVAEQVDELANKQETIDTLNQQLIELYKTMEQNANGIIEKDDEIVYLQELLETNKKELDRLQKDNDEQKKVVDKLLSELHAHRANTLQLPQLESDLQSLTAAKQQLETANEDLQRRNKDQLDKLKKYAANLKKRTTHCLELEAKLKDLEKKDVTDALNELSAKLGESERMANGLRGALHTKTSEWLDANEKVESLEANMQELRKESAEMREEVVQLQNALAASQECVQSDWGQFDNGQSPTEELIEANAKIAQLERDLALANEMSAKVETLEMELRAKSEQLETTMETLDNVQIELQQVRELEREREQALRELHFELDSKRAEVERLSQQLAANENKANEQRLSEIQEELRNKSLKFEKSKAVIKERNNQIHRLQSQLKELQDKLSAQPEEEPEIAMGQTQLGASKSKAAHAEYEALKVAYDQLNDQYDAEKTNFLQTINRLETLHDGIQAKLQEDMAYIETLEQENNKFKEKICKLEECVGTFEERRASMERRVNILDAQMQTRADEYVKTEDELIYRLNMLADHDDLIGQRLLSSQEEKEEWQERHGRVHQELHALQTKYAQLAKEYDTYKSDVVSSLQQEAVALRQKLTASEKELQHIRSVYDAKLAAKTTELDELECDLSDQLEKMNAEKRANLEALEMARDECGELKDEIVRLKEAFNALEQTKHELDRETTWLRMQNENSQQDQYELQELRMQTLQDKTEIDNLRAQIETLAANHEVELQALRTQITELDSLRMQVGQNQTDDQVFIETENKRLTDLLAEKDALIENYQRQNLQYQMAAMAPAPTTAQPVDFFAATFGLPSQNAGVSANDELERLQQELNEKSELSGTLQRDVSRLQTELQSLIEGNAEMQRQLTEKNREIENLRSAGTTARPTAVVSAPAATATTQNVGDMVIPAPPMFFNTDQMVHSPFDEIVAVRANENALEATAPPQHGLAEQPTIEDLQRNVSDLEKHAQDLENKLALRNQREIEYQELQGHLAEAENRVREREQQLQLLESRLRQLEETATKAECERLAVHENLNVVQQRLNSVEKELDQRNAQFSRLELELQTKDQTVDDTARVELERAVEELKATLSDRERLLNELQQGARQELQKQQAAHSLESQIIEEPILEQFKPTLDMFFGVPPAADDVFDGFSLPKVSDEPVQEEVIVPKRAYVCQPVDEAAGEVAALNLNDAEWGDEGWGDIGGEAEPMHVATKLNVESTAGPQPSLIGRTRQLEIQLEEQEDKVQELQALLEHSEQQRQELQVKSVKIMKKLKEYKTKIDELQAAAATGAFRKSTSVESSSMFDDLDAAIQEELKSQIRKLEDKLAEQLKVQESCGIEKEKLLKRIDVLTAGNERMSEMKERQDMEVHMYQARIKELQDKLNSLEDWGTEAAGERADHEDSVAPATSTPANLPVVAPEAKPDDAAANERIAELLAENQELQALVEEEKANVARAEELARNLQNQITACNNSAATLAATEKSKYNDLLYEHQNLETQCNELRECNAKLTAQTECRKDSEHLQSELLLLRTQHTELLQANVELQQSYEALAANAKAIGEQNEHLKKQLLEQSATECRPSIDELSAQLQEKDAEIVHLKQRIEDLMREDQTEKLVLEILTKNQEISTLKLCVKNLEDDKLELEHNLSLQITKAMQGDKGAEPSAELSDRIATLEEQNRELQQEKRNMEEELQVLNNHVLSSIELEDKMKCTVLELDMKNIEIAELRKSLESMVASNGGAQPADIAAINAQWETVVEQKCGEIAEMWRAHLDVRERDFKAAESRYKDEIAALKRTFEESVAAAHAGALVETSATPSSASEATTESGSQTSSNVASKDGTPLHTRRVISENESDSADAMIEKMQAALESQEVEIVTLKEQLAIRSAEYARLAAQYDPFQLQAGGASAPAKRNQQQAGDNASLVPKYELDLAMYMLHQRDMRCEEMTHEIVSLLEERDTLQLKLSNTLRQVEAIKTHAGDANVSNSEALATGETATPATTEDYDSSNELSQKLSQLQTVNHSKDKVIVEEREKRIRQMEQIQKDVSKMPPAAVSELVGSDFSHTNQSPSTVLLNWLWGNQSNSGGAGSGLPPNK